MAKLHEVLAVEKDVKTREMKAVTELHKATQVRGLFEGMARTYTPFDAEGEKRPPEVQVLQRRVPEMIDEVGKRLASVYDIAATKNETNTKARADVVIDGQTFLTGIPSTTLLSLEKELEHLHTFVGKLPVLDPSVVWKWNAEAGQYETDTIWTNRTAKTPVPITLAPATDKHPAQVKLEYEDRSIGKYEARRFSGAISQTDKNALLDRVSKFRDGVKAARERANTTEVSQVKIGETVFGYIFGSKGN